MPEIVTKVFLSKRNINRFTCEGGLPVKDVIYQEDNWVKHKKSNDNVYITFLYAKDRYGKKIYSKDPAEFYVLCGGEATNYTIIGIPKDIPAQHIKLAAPNLKIKKNGSLFKGMPFEKQITTIMKQAYKSEFPESYSITELEEPIKTKFEDINATLKQIARIEGEGLQVKIFHVSLKKDKKIEYLYFSEKDFIKQSFSKNPIAIALDSQTIETNEITRLLIIEQIKENG